MDSFVNHKIDFEKERLHNYKLVLDIMQKEYQQEKDISNSLDAKSGIFISAHILLCTIFLESLVSNYYVIAETINSYSIYFQILIVSILIIMTITIVLFIKSMSLRNYNAVNYGSVFEVAKSDVSCLNYLEAILTQYKAIVDHNTERNRQKANYNKKGVVCFVICAIGIVGTFPFVLSLF